MSNPRFTHSFKLTIVLVPFYLFTKYLVWFSSLLMKTGLIGIMPTFDSLFGFFSKDISTIVSWTILFIIGYNTEIAITQRVFGQFKRKRFMDALTVACSCMLGATLAVSIIGPDNPDMILTVISSNFQIIMVILTGVVGCVCVILHGVLAQESRIARMTGPISHFWKLIFGIEGERDPIEEYAEYKAISNRFVRKIALRIWTVCPVIAWLVIIISFGVSFCILSLSSLIFLFSIILWIIWHFRSLGIERNFLESLHGSFASGGLKGMFGHILVVSGLLASLLFFNLLATVALAKGRTVALFFIPPFAYLFYFWYRQGRRLRVLVDVWREYPNTREKMLTPCLPTGGYILFGIICFLSLINPLIHTYYSSPIISISSLVISIFAILIIVLSLKCNEKEVSGKNVRRENILIIVAILTQLFCTDLIFWLWLKDSSFVLGPLLGGLLVFVWLYPDWCRFINRKYKKESVANYVLCYCMIPLGISPILTARTRNWNLIFLLISILFAFLFCVGLILVLSTPKKPSRGSQDDK